MENIIINALCSGAHNAAVARYLNEQGIVAVTFGWDTIESGEYQVYDRYRDDGRDIWTTRSLSVSDFNFEDRLGDFEYPVAIDARMVAALRAELAWVLE